MLVQLCYLSPRYMAIRCIANLYRSIFLAPQLSFSLNSPHAIQVARVRQDMTSLERLTTAIALALPMRTVRLSDERFLHKR